MKRHPALVPLSREHHEGLLLAVRLQQGPRALLRLWSHDLRWQAEFVTRFFDDHLAHHFAAEEEILFPAAVKYFPADDPIVERLLDDHREMRAMITFLRNPDEKKLECTLTQFGKLLEEHIRCEEREFFDRCEKSIPDERWLSLDNELQQFQQRASKATS